MSIPQNDKQSAVTSPAWRLFVSRALRLFEIALVIVCLDHVASFIVNADHCGLRAAVELRIPDCVTGRVRFAVPQPTEWQRIGNQIDAAAILTRTNLLEALRAGHRDIHITLSLRCGEQKRQNADCRSMVIPIPLTFRWKISTPCYAIGEHAIIRKAAENTFSSLGWRAKWKEQHCLEYVRWGVLAKLHSKISTVGVVPTDRVAIWVYETNNPSVSLVKTSFYTKIKFFNKDKQQKRIADFCRTVECEFRKFKIILIEHNRWAEAVSRYPQLRCSPVWGRGRYGLNEPVA